MYSLLILVPFFSVIILNLPLRGLMRRAAFWLCLFILLAQICLVLFPSIYSWSMGSDIFASFLKFHLEIDNLSRVLLLSIGIVLFSALFVRRCIFADEEKNFNFFNLLLLILSGMNGLVLVRDIFSLYVFIEITSVCSFILIGFNKDAPAFEAAFKYIVLSVFATVLMLTSIALLLIVAGDTSFSSLSSALVSSPDRFFISCIIGIFLCALFIKGGIMPFHGWLPDAYSAAPHSVSVLLAGIVTKTVGIYTLIRIVNSVFGLNNSLQNILLILGTLSIVAGALAALGQNNFKRMLAYSSISQVGYIVLGLGCGTALGIAGAIFHLFNHSIFKSLLFVNAAAVETQTGTGDMDKLSGLGKNMPITSTASILASLSASGIPPLAGFWSKLVIIIALWLSGFYTYAVIAVLASVLTLGYLLSMQRRVFFGQIKEGLENIKEANLCIMLPTIVLAAIVIGVGLFFPFMINTFILPVSNIFGG
jgi:proton-translocating NADH-quinone oxidoreductase chain N